MFVIKYEAEVFGVIEIGGDENVELSIAQHLEGAHVGVTLTGWDLDSVALEASKQIAGEGLVGVFEFFDECFGFSQIIEDFPGQ